MKYHWCRYPAFDPPCFPNWFVVGFRADGTTALPSRNVVVVSWWHRSYLEKHGFVIGPEIPGPPEDEKGERTSWIP